MQKKWRTVRLEQELVSAAERTIKTGRYRSLSEFVSEAIELRLDELKEDSEKHVTYPVIHERLLCSPNHMWALITPEGNIRVGLSDYAQERLRGITNIETEPVGYEAEKGKPFGFAETWMFKFDLYPPVSGKIVKTNNILLEKPSTINDGSYEATWIAELKPNDRVTLEEELRDLMQPKQYKKWAVRQHRFAHATS